MMFTGSLIRSSSASLRSTDQIAGGADRNRLVELHMANGYGELQHSCYAGL